MPLQTITNENPAGPSLGTIPQARFLLAMLHMLSLKHGANSLSLLLNSGTLALTQSILRLIGEARGGSWGPGALWVEDGTGPEKRSTEGGQGVEARCRGLGGE